MKQTIEKSTGIVELTDEQAKKYNGGNWYVFAAGALWLEVRDAWADGGAAIKEAFEAGRATAK